LEITAMLKKRGLQGDLFLRKLRTKSVEYEGGIFKGYRTEESTGYGLRVIRQDGRMGFYASNHPMGSEEVLEKALEMSEFGEQVLFDIPSYPGVLEWKNFVDPKIENMDVREMVELGNYIVAQLREEYPEILVNLEIVVGREERSLSNHHEEHIAFARTFFQIEVSANRTLEDDILEVYAERSWGNRDVDVDGLLQELKNKIEYSKHIHKIQSGQYPVIFTPQGTLVLLHSLLYGLNGKNVVFGRSPLGDKFGKVVLSSLFSLIEVPHEPWSLGSCPFDDEGIVTPTERVVIESGRLERGFFDLWSAIRMKQMPGGNGFRASYQDLPEPGFAALRIKNGLRDRETLVEELEEGLVVDSVLGLGQSNVASGSFSCGVQLGFYVQGGEIRGRVKDVMLNGNVYQALKNVKEISRDDRWVYGKMLLPYILVEPLQIEA
ncbi:MAG: TldD/PmbA family protein, partial [Candidatus Caldatribacteriaceae bacterium]